MPCRMAMALNCCAKVDDTKADGAMYTGFSRDCIEHDIDCHGNFTPVSHTFMLPKKPGIEHSPCQRAASWSRLAACAASTRLISALSSELHMVDPEQDSPTHHRKGGNGVSLEPWSPGDVMLHREEWEP